ncbi:MAG: class A beta-lactamase-related serine hydrolase [Candidatus Omnitrophica bacterium]|nr:class A beta-lactamase-related serine hydrolase [Candidatus Omnitrophota bacterium]
MKRKTFFFIAGFFILVSFFLVATYFQSRQYYQRKQSFVLIEKALNSLALEFFGQTAIIVADLKYPDLAVSINPDKPFVAASLIKLPMLTVLADALKQSILSLDQKVVVRRADITGGSGVLKAKKTPIELSLYDLISLMVTKSDNTATNKIIDLLGFDYIADKFQAHQLNGSILSRKMMDFSSRRKGIENFITATDAAAVLKRLYTPGLNDQAFSELMIEFLKNQKVRDRLPRYLPDQAVIAHKTGLERSAVHDAGIVFTVNGDYIICVLTGDFKNYLSAKKFIAKVSWVTYNLYNREATQLGDLPQLLKAADDLTIKD